jgi:hypothetical protein
MEMEVDKMGRYLELVHREKNSMSTSNNLSGNVDGDEILHKKK